MNRERHHDREDASVVGRPPHFPPFARGMRIGLFGGSFDPPHEGHRLVSLIAMRRLGLDRVWWLVTPGNPLKRTDDLPPLSERVARAAAMARHPKIIATGFEAALGARYTFQTIASLLRRCPGVRFVWIMGADNLGAFHKWRRWQDIARSVPIAAVDRPGSSAASLSARAAAWFDGCRIDEALASRLPFLRPPALVFLHGLQCDLSSTQLRRDAELSASRSPPEAPPVAARRAHR